MSKFTAAQLVELAEAVYAGAELEHLTDSGWTVLGTKAETIDALLHSWRIKPAKKIIDIAHFIKSGIDCEFSDSGVFEQIGSLIGIKEAWAQKYCRSSAVGWRHCRPRMNHKMYHDGGECPLPEGFVVKFYFRDGESLTNVKYKNARWYLCQEGRDIIGYEVLGLADGWAYPWECEE